LRVSPDAGFDTLATAVPGKGSLADRVPDARAIWLYREKRAEGRCDRGTVRRFRRYVLASGDIAMSGRIVEPAPLAAKTGDEKKALEAGRIPGLGGEARETAEEGSGCAPGSKSQRRASLADPGDLFA
jgi:hypothetical protein